MMLPEARREHIVDEAQRLGMVRVGELSAALGVTQVTIRRDLAELTAAGVLRRVHGGAAPAATGPSATAPSATGRSIGMVVPSLRHIWPDVVQGAREECATRGLRLVLRGSTYESTDDRDHIGHLLDSSDVAGLVLAPREDSPATAETLDWLAERGVPAVLVERDAFTSGRVRAESVLTDHSNGTASAIQHLADLGHRRIGLVVTTGSPHNGRVRQGWRDALTGLGLPAGFSREFASIEDADITQIITDALDAGVTALVTNGDFEAIALAQHCQAHGIGVPQRLSIVAYNDEVAALFNPPLTAVQTPRTSLGRTAVALLADRLADPSRPRFHVTISPRLVVRDSTARPPDLPS